MDQRWTLKLLLTPPTTTVNFLAGSSHSRKLKLGIQLYPTKLNSKTKINWRKSYKKSKMREDYHFQAEQYSDYFREGFNKKNIKIYGIFHQNFTTPTPFLWKKNIFFPQFFLCLYNVYNYQIWREKIYIYFFFNVLKKKGEV